MSDTGATKQAAAAIAGNMAHESGGFIPGIREGGPFGQSSKPWPKGTVGKGYGWAQWTNSRPGGRYDAFIKSFGGDYNKIPSNADNYRFLMQELSQGNGGFISKGSGTSGSFAEFKKKTDVTNATVDFRKTWERAGIAHDEARINYAKKFLAQMAVGGRLAYDPGDKVKPSSPEYKEKFSGDSRWELREKKLGEYADGGIIAGAKRIIGQGKGFSDQCANTTRAALRAAGHPGAGKRTTKGDLDTPKGTAYNAPSFAASFGGSDMGTVIKNKAQIKAGDIILWKADVNKGGNVNKGAITHVGIAADDGLKHQYDHNVSRGFHYRPHWHSAAGTSWFAGIRLGGTGTIGEGDTSGGDTSGGGGGDTGGGEAPQEPKTVESMTRQLEDLLNQFGKAMADTNKGFQLPAQEKPTQAPAATPAGSIQPATSTSTKQLEKAKEMELKARRDKESDMFVPAPTIIQQTVQQPVINNVGQSNTVVIQGTPSPMLTGRPRRSNN
jgi:hypothetical protein